MDLVTIYNTAENEIKMKFHITFWKNVNNKFGARAGAVDTAPFMTVQGYETPELAISAAIEEMIKKHKNDKNTSTNNTTEP